MERKKALRCHVRKAVQQMKGQRFQAAAMIWATLSPPFVARFACSLYFDLWDKPAEATRYLQDQMWIESMLGGLLCLILLFCRQSLAIHIGRLMQTVLMSCYVVHRFFF